MNEGAIPEYPKQYNFAECPNCGGTDTIAGLEFKAMAEKGQVNPKNRSAVFVSQVAIMDPTKFAVVVPYIHTEYDVCTTCGTVYCTHANVTQVTPQIKPPHNLGAS